MDKAFPTASIAQQESSNTIRLLSFLGNYPMTNIQRVFLQDEDGTTYNIFVETTVSENLPPVAGLAEDDLLSQREKMGFAEDAAVKLQEIHGTIHAYAQYAIGAFKNFPGAEVEEVNLKFGLKIGGKAGLPILTAGSAEANFEISVKCKFPERT
jgi:Trypsin-co-occurring domain 1